MRACVFCIVWPHLCDSRAVPVKSKLAVFRAHLFFLIAMETFAKCRARIGAARMLLEPLSGELRDVNSGIQRNAIVSLFSNKKGCAISPERLT